MSQSIQPSSIHDLLSAKCWREAEQLLQNDQSVAFKIGER